MLECTGDPEWLWSKEKKISYEALYRGQEMSEIYSTQTLKENVVRWIKISPLDATDTAPPEVINDASQILKRQ